MTSPAPVDEEARLLAVEDLAVLDIPPEERSDRVTRLSTRLFGVPMAAVALVGRDRWGGQGGLAASDIVLSESFCNVAIRQPDILVIEDTQEDERFKARMFRLEYGCGDWLRRVTETW